MDFFLWQSTEIVAVSVVWSFIDIVRGKSHFGARFSMLHFVLLKANIKLEFYDVTTLIFNFTILKLELKS